MNESDLNMTALAEELERYIQDLVPKSNTLQKYGGTLFTLKLDEKEGQFCGVFVYKQHVQISFSNGAKLKDPKALLVGSGKHRRHINFSSLEQVNFSELKKLLEQASSM